jgi:iron(III) transport system permease protein
VLRSSGVLTGEGSDRLILWGAVLLVAYLTLVPLLFMIYGSFRTAPPGYLGSFTLNNYVRAIESPIFGKAVFNSFLFSALSGLVSFPIGTLLAWVTERTNAPFRGFVYASVVVSIIMPGILITIAWVLLLSPGIGLINHLLVYLLGLQHPPFNAFSFGGMVWVFGSDHFTVPFLLMAAAFRSMDPALEEAGRTAGAGGITILKTITFKLAMPAVFATWLLIFIRGLETFETPAILGVPAKIRVLATEILFAARRSFPPDYNLAAAYGMFYVFIVAAGLYLYHRATRVKERFAVISGRGFQPNRMGLGVWRYPVGFLVLFVLGIVVYFPIGILVYASFLPWYMVPSGDVFKQMSLQNYAWVFQSAKVWSALWNNTLVGLTSATITVLLTGIIAWIVVRTQIRGRQILDLLCFSPVAFPGIVFGLSLLWVYLILPVPVYGTLWLLIIAYVSKFMPIAIRISMAAIIQIKKDLEEVSEVCGASWSQTFRKVVVPLILPGLLAGWVYVLSLTFKVLSIPILLGGANTEMVPLIIFDLYEGGEYTKLTALGTVVSLFVLVISALARWISGRWGLERVSA